MEITGLNYFPNMLDKKHPFEVSREQEDMVLKEPTIPFKTERMETLI